MRKLHLSSVHPSLTAAQIANMCDKNGSLGTGDISVLGTGLLLLAEHQANTWQ